jgi:phage shock protein A
MANPFVKAWKYLMALFGSKVDEYADPKVQIQQAIEDAQRQHQGLTQQAAQVIGNQRQLEMRLNRQLADIEKLQANVRQALTLADQAAAAGDAAGVAAVVADLPRLVERTLHALSRAAAVPAGGPE